ncbi:MAG TPA: universal stress protein [bacterium]|nr:universal stress protein [bacterium]
MEKILLYIISEETRGSWKRAIEISNAMSATLFGLYVIDEKSVKRISKLRGEDPLDTAIEMEEEGWKLLYHLEDMAINSGVKSKLNLEEGDPVNTIKRQVKKFDIDMVILGYKAPRGGSRRKTERIVDQIIEHVPCPILIDKEGGK